MTPYSDFSEDQRKDLSRNPRKEQRKMTAKETRHG